VALSLLRGRICDPAAGVAPKKASFRFTFLRLKKSEVRPGSPLAAAKASGLAASLPQTSEFGCKPE